MDDRQLQKRTKAFAVSAIHLVGLLPDTRTADILGGQLLRSATSVGANYRAACRARSRADFINKLGIVEEEADECMYWLELLIESHPNMQTTAKILLAEANEITAMVVASIKKSRFRSKTYSTLRIPNSALRGPAEIASK